MTERRKNQSEVWTYFTQLFIYFITVNKYRFCISVIGYINLQIIGIGYKNQYWSITTTEYYWVNIGQKFRGLFQKGGQFLSMLTLKWGKLCQAIFHNNILYRDARSLKGTSYVYAICKCQSAVRSLCFHQHGFKNHILPVWTHVMENSI